MAGRKAHEPTKAQRQLVELHATIGTPQAVIADLLEIDRNTLMKYYRAELDQATHKANAQVGGALFKKAMGGDTTAMIFWMKTRARWKETQAHEHTSPDGSMTPKGRTLDEFYQVVNVPVKP
jgi:hypothetical protein